jgi:protein phosphatase 1L
METVKKSPLLKIAYAIALFFIPTFTLDAQFFSPEKGLYGHAELQGKRPTMEDAHDIKHEVSYQLYGLYDGHGGSKVSHYLAHHLNKAIVDHSLFKSNPLEALFQSCVTMQKELDPAIATNQGSTALTALIKNKTLYVANIGDSRAVLCSKGSAVALSNDHKPDRPDEYERINKAGGFIYWAGCWRVQGVLGLSRAMGDKGLAPYVIAEPEIIMRALTNHDEFLILACDGVWDVLDNQKAVDIVHNALSQSTDCEHAAQILVDAAYKAGSSDNISAIIIRLQQ